MTSHDVDVDIDIDELAAVVAAMEACGRALADQAAALEATHRRLHQDWSGLSGEAHGHFVTRWRGSFEEMATTLAGLRSLGSDARARYCGAVEANLALWRQVT